MFPVPDGPAETVSAQMVEWLASNNMPKVTSLNDTTHVFHYSEHWNDSHLMFVNRNGNQQRLIWVDGKWRAYATWRSILPLDDWEFKGLVGDDPEQVIAKMSIGPGIGKMETLCFLPKEATASFSRSLVYRHHIVQMRKVDGLDKFYLRHTESGRTSPTFTGKPWESSSAVDWCDTELADCPPLIRGPSSNPFTREREQAEAAASLEDNVLFGAWG